ncbi:MAG: helicase [Pseudomonadota bacterium]
MKFKLALWILGFMLERASKNNPQVRQKLQGQDMILEVGCEEGHARHFIIRDQQVLSYPGKASAPVYLGPSLEPTFAITFDSARTGYETLTAKDKQLAMIGGIQDGRIHLLGNPLYLGWFQSVLKLTQAGH